jgi:hypothetical protein
VWGGRERERETPDFDKLFISKRGLRGRKGEDVGVLEDNELKLEEIEASHTRWIVGYGCEERRKRSSVTGSLFRKKKSHFQRERR